jgi:NADH-quinone oxidoreductase subunit J
LAEVLFFIAALGAIGGAVAVIWSNNPFYSVLALVGHLVSLAALFLLLRAEFVAAAQVVVYAGAVMVLYVFVVAYVGGEEPEIKPLGPRLRGVTGLFVGVLFVQLSIVILGTGLTAIETEGAPYEEGFGWPVGIGRLLLTKFLLAFELAAMLLLIAAVGAVVLARRRGGVSGDQADTRPVLSVMDLARPPGTGTMAEGVSGLPELEGETPATHPKAGQREELGPGGGQGRGRRREREGGW